ncbi:MAG: hypothetical protein ACOVSW_18975 [Candidatus Kapaibacteriota bacterium]|jgi:hypothetical protein
MREITGIVVVLLLGSVAWLFFHGGGIVAISPLDWVIGLLTLIWLITVVTVPWNIYFQARAIIAEADESKKRSIVIDDEKIAYTKRWADRALIFAVVLHLSTAAGMYCLALAGISFIGYFGAISALILTFVRPILRAYAYVRKRLAAIREEIIYPREDIITLKNRLEEVIASVERLEKHLDTEQEDSWASAQVQAIEEQRQKLDTLRHHLDNFTESNKLDHEKITRDAQNAMSQAMADAAIVNHVREIVRFFKEA